MTTNWTCQAKFAKEPLTVGDKYQVNCQGEAVEWKGKSLNFEFPDNLKYNFRVIKFDEVKSDSIAFTATTYQTGEYALEPIVLSDGENKVNLSPWSLKVDSVVQVKPGEPPQPFGPFGPFLLPWPLWVWIALGTILVSLFSGGLFAYLRRQRLKAWRKLVEENMTTLSPYHQFYKDIRKLQRLHSEPKEAIAQLDEAFRLYFLRELEVPTAGRPASWFLKHIRRKNPRLIKAISKDLATTLRELEKVKAKSLSERDSEQLTRQCQTIVDTVWQGFQEKQI